MTIVSESVVIEMIRHWKAARLSSGVEALDFPTENILSKAGKGRVRSRPPVGEDDITDADIIQRIVQEMPYELRSVFEAYHLRLIREQRCRDDLPHKARALILGIDERKYRRRRKAAFRFCQERIGELLDSVTADR